MTIAQIKQSLTLSQVLSHYHLTPDRNNRLLCPFHDDHTPSLQIYPRTNTWTCFSSKCQAGSGDQIDFIMRKDNCSKHQAILKAKGLTGQVNIPPLTTNKPMQTKQTPTKHITDLTRIAILTKYYQSTLQAMARSKKAQGYAGKRNLDYHKLGIGYSGADIGRRWNKNLQDSALAMGLLKKTCNNFTPKLKYCLILPMRDSEGRIIDLYGRSIIEKKANGKPNTASRHFYLSGNWQGLYPGYPKPETTKLILAESHIDAASLQLPEITKDHSILALYGTNGFTLEHRQAIKELEQLQEVILFMDGDEAGKKAINKWSAEILQLNDKLKLSYVPTPQGEDINSLLQSHPSTGSGQANILTHLIKERLPVNLSSTFLISTDSDHRNFSEGDNKPIEIKKDPIEQKNNSLPLLPKLDTTNSELLSYTTPALRITVLGGIRITGLDRMKVTLKIQRLEGSFLPVRHSLDLYHARQAEHLCELMAGQLEIRSSKAVRIISNLTTALESYRQRRLEAMKPKTPKIYQMTPQDREKAMHYLKDPALMENTAHDIAASGIVGEEKNALIGYIVYLSRKREKPLHVMYLGSSGTGKTHVQEGLSWLTPAEDRIEATGLSDQALYYEGLKLKGKVLFIEDYDGAENIQYIIRELQSKGRIIKRVAWRDNKGHTQTIEVIAEGPLVISSCTTREKIYEDNANRCFLLYIDQSKAQDNRVMDIIKGKSAGRIKEKLQEQIRRKIQDVQRLLRPIKVYNPWADLIDLPSEVFKPRRSLPLLLGFIETITFYHQYQREIKTDDQTGERYITSTYEDIKMSFELLKDVLFNKSDELTRAAREFLELLKTIVKKGDTFYTKSIRKQLRMNASNMKRYMIELQRYDYVKIKSGNRYRGYEYEITDYDEYDRLQSSIDKRLGEILSKIKAGSTSGSVVQSGSKAGVNHLTKRQPVS